MQSRIVLTARNHQSCHEKSCRSITHCGCHQCDVYIWVQNLSLYNIRGGGEGPQGRGHIFCLVIHPACLLTSQG